MIQQNYNGTINSLFTNAAIDGVLTISDDDSMYFSTVTGPAQHDGRVTCERVEGGFQFRLNNQAS